MLQMDTTFCISLLFPTFRCNKSSKIDKLYGGLLIWWKLLREDKFLPKATPTEIRVSVSFFLRTENWELRTLHFCFRFSAIKCLISEVYLDDKTKSDSPVTLGARGFLREEPRSAISEAVKREKIDEVRKKNLWDQGTRLSCAGGIGDFRVVFRLCFKASPSAKPYIWKLFVLFTRKFWFIYIWIKQIPLGLVLKQRRKATRKSPIESFHGGHVGGLKQSNSFAWK